MIRRRPARQEGAGLKSDNSPTETIVLHLNLNRVRKYAIGGEAWPWRRLPD
ncbi:MAG TPA: hypothetical protein PKC23_05900 [Candidatus Desulfobacillus sp.]|nr:hypothetical protein [Candidatus Desulfobacillus sp.]